MSMVSEYLKRVECLTTITTPSEALRLEAVWSDFVKHLLRYGGRLFGTRRIEGASLWEGIYTLDKSLPVQGCGRH